MFSYSQDEWECNIKSAWAYRAGGGRRRQPPPPPPQFVGQTKPVGQYPLHSWAILAYYKNKWDNQSAKGELVITFPVAKLTGAKILFSV